MAIVNKALSQLASMTNKFFQFGDDAYAPAQIFVDPSTGLPLDYSEPTAVVEVDEAFTGSRDYTAEGDGVVCEVDIKGFKQIAVDVRTISTGGTVYFEQSPNEGLNWYEVAGTVVNPSQSSDLLSNSSASGRFTFPVVFNRFRVRLEGASAGVTNVAGCLLSSPPSPFFGRMVVVPRTSAGTDRSVNVTTTSQQLMASNSSRKGAIFHNSTDTAITLKFGTTAVAGAGLSQIVLPATMTAPWSLPNPVLTSRIDVIHGGSGNKPIFAWEF